MNHSEAILIFYQARRARAPLTLNLSSTDLDVWASGLGAVVHAYQSDVRAGLQAKGSRYHKKNSTPKTWSMKISIYYPWWQKTCPKTMWSLCNDTLKKNRRTHICSPHSPFPPRLKTNSHMLPPSSPFHLNSKTPTCARVCPGNQVTGP